MAKSPNLKKGNQNLSHRHIQNDEYDLGKNLNRINAYSKQGKKRYSTSPKVTATSDDAESIGSRRFYNRDIDKHSPTKTDGLSWDEYTRLDDKLSIFRGENDKAHTDLRIELENKIRESILGLSAEITHIRDSQDKFITKYWFGGTISALITLVGIWFMFSYNEIHHLPQKVNNLDNRMENLEITNSAIIDTLNHQRKQRQRD